MVLDLLTKEAATLGSTTSYHQEYTFFVAEQDERQRLSSTTSVRDWAHGTEAQFSKLQPDGKGKRFRVPELTTNRSTKTSRRFSMQSLLRSNHLLSMPRTRRVYIGRVATQLPQANLASRIEAQ